MKLLIPALAALGGSLSLAGPPADIPATTVRASREEGTKYAALKAIDGETGTHWAAANRLPQWLEIGFGAPKTIDRLLIRGVAQPDIYDNWARVTISFSTGTPLSLRFADSHDIHTVTFPARETDWVRFTVESTHKRTHYVGLSEVRARYVDHGEGDVTVLPQPAPAIPRAQQAELQPAVVSGLARLADTSWQGKKHPNLWVTWKDVELAKQHIRQKEWAQIWFRDTLRLADTWAALSDEKIRGRVPPPRSLFDNRALCPLCGARLRASFASVGKASCSTCKRAFPDAEHPDDGTGWTNPDTGEKTHFMGAYNEYAIDQFERILKALADAYALTAEEPFARAASVLFDQLAVTYPTCTKGPEWYPGDNPTRGGRLDRPYYQVARMLIWLVDDYDLLYNSPEWERPSVTGTGTRRQNTETNVIRNGGDYCLAEMTDYSTIKCLHNGYCDYLQGVLATGRVLDIDEYVEYDLTCDLNIYNFLENTIDRDGQYIETAFMYSSHAVELYCHHAEMLRNWKNPLYPDGINLYDHPKMRLAMLRSELDVDCAGHIPPLGDTGPDTSTIDLSRDRRVDANIQRRLEYLATRAGSAVDRQAYMESLVKYVGNVGAARAGTGGAMRRWLVYNAAPAPAATPLQEETGGLATPHRNTLLAYGRGIGILRAGSLGQSAALLRWGPTNNHGTPDEMNVNFFALGKEITYDPGYLWAHFRCGWTHATGAHNLVVVNEKNQLLGDGSGGSLDLWVETPGIEVVSADNPGCYSSEEVSQYRRTVALVDITPERHYFLDVFRVRGGRTHDYNWHFYGDMDRAEGVTLSDPELKGSLAGPEFEWWKKVQRNGWLEGVKEGFYWKAPPGNGYGFLHHVQRADAAGPCVFEWKLGERHAVPTLCFPAPSIVGASNGRYTNVLQTGVHFYRGEEAGDFIEYDLPVDEAGQYAIVAVVVKHDRYGIVRVSLDGASIGGPLNNYSPTRYHTPPIILGRRELAPGIHRVRFTVEGRDEESGGHFFGLRYLGLEKPDTIGRLSLKQRLGIRLSLAPEAPTELIAAKAKGTVGGDATYIISRRRAQNDTPLTSAFAAVVEPLEGPAMVEAVERLRRLSGRTEDDVVALRVLLANGRTDLVFDASAPSRDSVWAWTRDGLEQQVRFSGRFGVVQLDRTGTVTTALLHGDGLIQFGDFRFSGDGQAAEWEGVVERVDLAERRVYTRARLPAGDKLRGLMVDFANPAWPRRSPFLVLNVSEQDGLSAIHLAAASLTMARGKVAGPSPKPGFIVNSIPMDRAGARFGPNGYFDGRSLRSDDGEDWGRVTQVTCRQRFDVGSSAPVTPSPGTGFAIVELSPGDRFSIVRTQEFHKP